MCIRDSRQLADPSTLRGRFSCAWTSPFLPSAKISSPSFHLEVIMVLASLALLHRQRAADIAAASSPDAAADRIKAAGRHLMQAAGIFQYLQQSGLPGESAGQQGALPLHAEQLQEPWAALHEVCRAEFMQLSLDQGAKTDLSPLLLAKICVAIAARYAAAAEHLATAEKRLGERKGSELAPGKGEFFRHCDGAQRLFSALSYALLAKDAMRQHRIGEALGRQQLALEILQSAKPGSPPPRVLTPHFKNHMRVLSEAISQLQRDNNTIYYERVLPSTDPTVVARPEEKSLGSPTPFELPVPLEIPIKVVESSSCMIQ